MQSRAFRSTASKVIAFLFALAPVAQAATYYVDAAAGNDRRPQARAANQPSSSITKHASMLGTSRLR